MILLNIIGFIIIVAGFFIVFSISPFEFADSISKLFLISKSSAHEEKTIRQKVLDVTQKKNIRGIRKTINEAVYVLEMTNKMGMFSLICVISLVLMVSGLVVSLSMSNLILAPVLSIGFALLPFWYVIFSAGFYKKQLNNDLETALSVITNSYIRCENIITAIEENVMYLPPPINDVFRVFLTQTKLINSNIKYALEGLKSKVDNDVYREWLDAVIACQSDKNLKSTLPAIVAKLSNTRIVSADLDHKMYEPMKEFVTMVILVVINIPMLYFLKIEWFNMLVYHPIGKTILAFTFLVIFYSLANVIKISKPIEYRKVNK